MLALLSRFLFFALILAGLSAGEAVFSSPLQMTALDLVSPAACPASGCAAGQRLNLKVDFTLSTFDPARSPNVQVCVYTPINWSASQFDITPIGTITGSSYTANIISYCENAPAGYNLLGGAIGTLPASSFGDSLPLVFRIGKTATAPGSVRATVLEQNNLGTWVRTGQAVNAIPVAPASGLAYVAVDPASCGMNSPCYVNSLDDLPGGYGSALKDSIDASSIPASLYIIGNLPVKSNSVVVNQPHIIRSNGSGRITYNGSTCIQPILSVTAGATIRNLSIDDGSCNAPDRTLIQINSTNPVSIESNTLMNGLDAIHVASGNTASTTVRFNQVTGNSGYAIYLDSANTGNLEVVANNLFGNRSGAQVACNGASNRVMDHNFWGAGVQATSGASQCTVSNDKQLGAPILLNSGAPGVQAQRVTVGTTRQNIFNDSLGIQRTSAGEDFGLYVVNHGAGSLENIPFASGSTGNPMPCSNFWDIFLSSPTAPTSAKLNLFFKYNLNAGCIATVESAQYCGLSDKPGQYPLRWFDRSASSWKLTGGEGGQPTSCSIDNDEIQVTIDSSTNLPNFSDLQKLPFVVGLPSSPPSVAFTSLSAQAGNTAATIGWTTSAEVNVAGYYVQRSTTSNSGFSDVSGLLESKGIGGGGSTYSFTNTALTNNTVYYYRLKILGLDGSSIYSSVVSVTPIPPTATHTFTPTNTVYVASSTSTRTSTRTATYFFRSSTPTRTYTPTPTSPFKTVTSTRSVTPASLTPPATAAQSKVGYPAAPTTDPATQLALTRSARTAEAILSATPTPTPTPEEGSGGPGPLTWVMAILAIGAIAGGAIYLAREQMSRH